MFSSHKDRVIQNPLKMIADPTATYGCEICDELYFSETEVAVHRQTTHAMELPVPSDGTCLICTKEFENNFQLIAHVKSVHLLSSRDAIRVEQQIYVCDMCSKIFFVKDLLEIHILTRHKNFYGYERKPCPMCKKRVLVSSMWYHKERHCSKSVSTCPLCLKKLPNIADLLAHIEDHRKYLKCEICLFETRILDNFRWHLLNSHKLTEKTGKIDEITARTFFIPTNKHMHYRYSVQFVANGLNVYNMLSICVLCREICQTTQQMVTHMLEHMEPVKSEVKIKLCSCGQHFTTDILLKHHIFKLKGLHKVIHDEKDIIPVEFENNFVGNDSVETTTLVDESRMDFVIVPGETYTVASDK